MLAGTTRLLSKYLSRTLKEGIGLTHVKERCPIIGRRKKVGKVRRRQRNHGVGTRDAEKRSPMRKRFRTAENAEGRRINRI